MAEETDGIEEAFEGQLRVLVTAAAWLFFRQNLVDVATGSARRMFDALANYAAATGSAAVPTRLAVDGLEIGNWVTAQRNLHQMHKLPPDRDSLLEALPGWTWNPRDDRWAQGVSELREILLQGLAAHPMTQEMLADALDRKTG